MTSGPMVAFKPIRVPLGRMTSDASVYAAVVAELDSFAEDLKSDFEDTTIDWKIKPLFVVRPSLNGNAVTFFVYTDHPIYRWVNNGTRKHVIKPRRGHALALATVITVISPLTGKARPRTAVVRGPVNHPGIKARNFDVAIMRNRKPTFSPRMRKAIETELLRSR
jgi:hypothetical protein